MYPGSQWIADIRVIQRARACVRVRVIQLFLVPLIFALAIHSLQFQQIDNATAPVIRS